MDNTDFEMPSPKRQKTESPVNTSMVTLSTQRDINGTENVDYGAGDVTTSSVAEKEPSSNEKPERKEEDMLDVLMQHVESEAAAKDLQTVAASEEQQPKEEEQVKTSVDHSSQMLLDVGMGEEDDSAIIRLPEQTQYHSSAMRTAQEPLKEATHSEPGEHARDDQDLPRGLEPTSARDIEQLRVLADANDIPPTSDTLVSDQLRPATEAQPPISETPNQPQEAREWETDSSPYSTDSSDTSTDADSSEDDEDNDEEYTLLDPYEQARILMAEDGGGGDDDNSDGEGRRNAARANPGLRTVNEKPEEILPRPNINITESTAIEELGSVQAIVENTVLINAKTSGEYRVLESNSLLCTAARLPIGVVSETLGRVEAPLYTVRFASASDIQESGVNEKGTKIYYVPDHSTFVFTQPLKSVKGSDASNFHDEEVGDDEMEFSDDEAEAEHKRQMKLRKRGIDPATIPPPSRGGRGGRGQRGRPGRGGNNHMHSVPESDTASAYGTAPVEMNYDDVEEGETEYTPLRRPENMAHVNPHAFSATGPMSPPQQHQNLNPQQNRDNNQDFRGGRGGRGRGNFNHNNSRGRGRGNHIQPNRGSYQSNRNNAVFPQNNYTPSSTTSMYSNSNPNPSTQNFHSLPPPPPPPPPPPAPQLTPSGGPYVPARNYGYSPNGTYSPTTIPPSPMTPLPGGQFNFNSGAAQSQPQYPGHGQWAQYHANQNMQYQQQQPPTGQFGNADAIAQVQRTLEELRRSGPGNGGFGASGNPGWDGRG